jgi:hypothetical protein
LELGERNLEVEPFAWTGISDALQAKEAATPADIARTANGTILIITPNSVASGNHG